jgi:putative heme-binding domain-containing protein
MLERLGFKHFAYDWRAEHIPTFDAEIDALQRHGISLDAFWVAPGELNRESRIILDMLKKHAVKTQLWVLLDLGADRVTGPEQEKRVSEAAKRLRPLADEARKIGCSLALYNHGGWFGEPDNQLAIIDELKRQGVTNVGIVYNLHHGHDHLERLPELLKKMMPHLWAVNLNGTDPGGDRVGRKILPLGQGSSDLVVLRQIVDSGYRGPIGILGHTMDDAHERLRDNLDGLDWLVPQLEGKAAGPVPKPRTPVAARPAQALQPDEYDPKRVAELLQDAQRHGDVRHGAEVFASPKFACLTCHRVAGQGGTVGPELTTVGGCVKPEEIVESVLWPRREIKEGYATVTVATTDGKTRQAYKQSETDKEITLRDPATSELVTIAKSDIEATRDGGTLMPDGLTTAMSRADQRDLVRFLLDLGKPGSTSAESLVKHAHMPAEFSFSRDPLHPEDWPSWKLPVNRDRVYDFYGKEAEYFLRQATAPMLLPQYPGIDGGRHGHWGNQNEVTWVDGRWNNTDLGSLMSGIFRGAGVTVPKGVCVRLGENGELAACFNPETLCYEAVWTGGFVKFSNVRHGFMDGLLIKGTPLPRPEGEKPKVPFTYRGFYRFGKRVAFAYRVGDVELLDAPWVENGKFTRTVAPLAEHPLAAVTKGGPPQWPQTFEVRGALGNGKPYAIDDIPMPFENPWNALMFAGGHGFSDDGVAYLCTMQGDVWKIDGIDAKLEHVRWRRFASGLHQALGLVVADGAVFVIGRDQITRLQDLNSDGEADFYECVNNAYFTSTAGHDFICGLERDAQGRFYTVSGKQGLIRISADGKTVETLATGFRNADGVGMAPDGTITVPNSEGEWTPASMVCEAKTGGHYGYGGPKNGRPPDVPLVYLPRGLDNSSGAPVFVASKRFGPLDGQWIHFSFGAGAQYLMLKDQANGQAQGAVVPLPGEFRAGPHRGRFNPEDGQLYVSGMAGWGSYTIADGCFQRVRYTGDPVQLPIAFHAYENGMSVTFSRPIAPSIAGDTSHHFAQVWNYRYSPSYGSPEFSPSHPGIPGHDRLAIKSVRILPDKQTLFLEMPEIQPVNQLQLHVRADGGEPIDFFATVHALAPPFTDLPNYQPVTKTIAAHPILADMATLAIKPVPNPWRSTIRGARIVRIEAGKNLTYSVRSFTARADEPIQLVFLNPDVVPHNWALARPGTLSKVGDLANKIIAEPDAASRHYIPRTDDIIAYSDIVAPQEETKIFFRAPKEPGRYPYLCTFPGHWMVMNGEMIVE